jgi:hypothetical protein
MRTLFCSLIAVASLMPCAAGKERYAVVLGKATLDRPAWKAVADALVEKHEGEVVLYERHVSECRKPLAHLRPRYTAFVEPPENIGRMYVAAVHRLTRRLDPDPYGDTLWGIVSAATPEGALRVARATEPATVRTALTLTGMNDRLLDRFVTISDARRGDLVRKDAKGEVTRSNDRSADRTALFADTLREMKPDLVVGSGHATETNLEMSFSRGNTLCGDGEWYGLTGGGERIPFATNDHPCVYLGAGNCLIGNFKRRPDTMAPTLLNAYGFNQFVGYTVPTWYGKGGWGTYKLWQHLAGRYSLAEAWFFNNQAIIHTLHDKYPEVANRHLTVSEESHGIPVDEVARLGRDASGMLFDRDVVAFYGDPALRVTLDPTKMPAGVMMSLVKERGRYILSVAMAETRGSVRPDSPLCLWLPERLDDIQILAGKEYEPLVTDDFIMVTKPDYEPGRTWKVVFTGRS